MPDELTPSTNIEKFLAKTAGESVELPEPATRIEKYLNKIASEQTITDITDTWLGEHIDPSTGYVLDSTLSLDNAAPPASAVGDLKTAIDALPVAIETDDVLGENLIKSIDMVYNSTGGTTSTKPELNAITVSVSNASSEYAGIRSVPNYISLETGKTYRLHAHAKVISGTALLLVSLRKNASGYPNNFSTNSIQGATSGEYDLDAIFTENGNSSLLAFFATRSKNQSAVVEYTDVYLKEVFLEGDEYSSTTLNAKANELNAKAVLADDKATVLPVAYERRIKALTSSDAVQGMCTDGNNIYYVTGNDGGTISKYSIASGETTVSSAFSAAQLGHGNSLTYNPDNQKIYCATMNYATITVFSTNLEFVETITLEDSRQPWGIAYDRKRHEFLVELSNEIVFYDRNFDQVRKITVTDIQNHTGQGFETDGDYIYRLFSPGTTKDNVIQVLDMNGNQITTSTYPLNIEWEEITTDWNGNWYVDMFKNGIYRIFFLNPSMQKQYSDAASEIASYFPSEGIDVPIPSNTPFIVTLTPTETDFSGTMDKTLSEIQTAYDAGKSIVFHLVTGVEDYTDIPLDFAAKISGNTYMNFAAYAFISTMNLLIVAETGASNDGTIDTYITTIYPLTPMT